MTKAGEYFSPSYEGEHPAKAGEGVVDDGTTPPLATEQGASPHTRGGNSSIQSTLKHIKSMLAGYSDASNLDADRILLHVLGKHDTSYLIAHHDEIISDQNLETIFKMTEQRKTGMPLAYILGYIDFYGRTFMVTPDVLIPRPDTEVLIDTALDYIQNNFDAKTEITIADICTGSGIIAITLALELPHARVIATDISPAALKIAKQNAEKHGIMDRIEFLEGDMFAAFSPPRMRGSTQQELGWGFTPSKVKTSPKIDLIVSNPPYVPSEELVSLRAKRSNLASPNTEKIATSPSAPRNDNSVSTRGLLFEPHIALDGGEDGLKFVNQIKEYSKKNNIPAIIETVGGEIIEI